MLFLGRLIFVIGLGSTFALAQHNPSQPQRPVGDAADLAVISPERLEQIRHRIYEIYQTRSTTDDNELLDLVYELRTGASGADVPLVGSGGVYSSCAKTGLDNQRRKTIYGMVKSCRRTAYHAKDKKCTFAHALFWADKCEVDQRMETYQRLEFGDPSDESLGVADPDGDGVRYHLKPAQLALYELSERHIKMGMREGMEPLAVNHQLVHKTSGRKDIDVEKNLVLPAIHRFITSTRAALEKGKNEATTDLTRKYYERALKHLGYMEADLWDVNKRKYFTPKILPETQEVIFVPTEAMLRIQQEQSLFVGSITTTLSWQDKRLVSVGRTFWIPPPKNRKEAIDWFLLFGYPSRQLGSYFPQIPPNHSIRSDFATEVAIVAPYVGIMRLAPAAMAKEVFKGVASTGAEIGKAGWNAGVDGTIKDFLEGNPSFARTLDHALSGARQEAANQVAQAAEGGTLVQGLRFFQDNVKTTVEAANKPIPPPLSREALQQLYSTAGSGQAIDEAYRREVALIPTAMKIPDTFGTWAGPWLRRPDNKLEALVAKNPAILSTLNHFFLYKGSANDRFRMDVDHFVNTLEADPGTRGAFTDELLADLQRELVDKQGISSPVAREIAEAKIVYRAVREYTSRGSKENHGELVSNLRKLVVLSGTTREFSDEKRALVEKLIQAFPDENTQGLEASVVTLMGHNSQDVPHVKQIFAQRRSTYLGDLDARLYTPAYRSAVAPLIAALAKADPTKETFRAALDEILKLGKAHGLTGANTLSYLFSNGTFGFKVEQTKKISFLRDELRFREDLGDAEKAKALFGENGAVVGRKLLDDENALRVFYAALREFRFDAERGEEGRYRELADEMFLKVYGVGGADAVAAFDKQNALLSSEKKTDKAGKALDSYAVKAAAIDDSRSMISAMIDRDKQLARRKNVDKLADYATQLSKGVSDVSKNLASRAQSLVDKTAAATDGTVDAAADLVSKTAERIAARDRKEKLDSLDKKLSRAGRDAKDVLGKSEELLSKLGAELAARQTEIGHNFASLVDKSRDNLADKNEHDTLTKEIDELMGIAKSTQTELGKARTELASLKSTTAESCGCRWAYQRGNYPGCEIYRYSDNDTVGWMGNRGGDDPDCKITCGILMADQNVARFCPNSKPTAAQTKRLQDLTGEVKALETKAQAGESALKEKTARVAALEKKLAAKHPVPVAPVASAQPVAPVKQAAVRKRAHLMVSAPDWRMKIKINGQEMGNFSEGLDRKLYTPEYDDGELLEYTIDIEGPLGAYWVSKSTKITMVAGKASKLVMDVDGNLTYTPAR